MANDIWNDRNFQYNSITYGFDVRSGMPIDRRFLLTREQMEILSKPPYLIMMPQNYFCVLKEDNQTKLYVYNYNNSYIADEDPSKTFPLAIGKFRLYQEGNPIVDPNNEDATLEPNADGNVELPIADSENFGLVKPDPDTLDIDPDTGRLRAHGLFRTPTLDGEGPSFKNANIIYYLTEDMPDHISGLYAWDPDSETYISIGGQPVDEKSIILNDESKIAAKVHTPIYIDDDYGISLKVGSGLTVNDSEEALALDIDPAYGLTFKDDKLSVNVDSETVILDDNGQVKAVNLKFLDPQIKDGAAYVDNAEDALLLINKNRLNSVATPLELVPTDASNPDRAGKDLRLLYNSETLELDQTSSLKVKDAINNNITVKSKDATSHPTLDHAVAAINELNRQLGNVYQWSPSGQYKYDNVAAAIESLTNEAKANKSSEGEAIDLTRTDNYTKFDVLYDGKNNTTDPSIILKNNKLSAIDFNNSEIKVRDHSNRAITSALKAINQLNSEIGDAHNLKPMFDSYGFADSETIVGILKGLADKPNLVLRGSEGIDVTRVDDNYGFIDVRIDSKGSAGYVNTVDPTIILTSEGTPRAGGNRLRAIDFQNKGIEVTNADSERYTSALQAINALNRQIGDAHDLNRYLISEGVELRADNVKEALAKLSRADAKDRTSEGDAIKLTSKTHGKKIDVLYDAKLANGNANNTDATIRLTTATETPGANKLRAVDFQNSDIKVKDSRNRTITSALKAINMLNSEMGDAHDLKTIFRGYGFVNSENVVGILKGLADRPAKVYYGSEGIRVIEDPDDDGRGYIDVLYDAKNNTTNPTITLKNNKLSAIDFQNSEIDVLTPAGRPITSALDAINALNSEIGPNNFRLTTGVTKNVKSAINWLNSEIGRVEGSIKNTDPVLVGNKNTYWAHQTAANTNPIYFTTSESSEGRSKLLHIYDFPVKDVRLIYNNSNTGIGSNVTIIEAKDSEGNGNQAKVKLAQPTLKVNTNNVVDLKLDPLKTIVSDRNGPDAATAGTGTYGLRVNIYASEGLAYTYGASTKATPVSLKVDLDTTKNLLGFKNGKLDIPWIKAKPTALDENKAPLIDSQGNAVWTSVPLSYADLPDKPKINGVTLAAGSEGTSLDTLHIQNELLALNPSIVFTSEGNKTGIKANYTGVDGISIIRGTTSENSEESMLVGHASKYPTMRSVSSEGYYKIKTDQFGHIIKVSNPLKGTYGIELANNGEIRALYDSMVNSQGTIYLANNSQGVPTYLAANNVRLTSKGDLLLDEIIPNEITIVIDSEQNTLADTFTVNEKIATALGTYRGAFDSVEANSEGTGLKNRYPIGTSGTATTICNNDYANVLYTVTTSEGEQQYLARYKAVCTADTSSETTIWTLTNWELEYRIPVSNFTLAELNAMRSTITKALVDTYNSHLVNYNNPHHVTKAQVGLGRVDNTSDSEKPLSNAAIAALALKQDKLTAGKFVNITNAGVITTTYAGEKGIAISTAGKIGHSNTAITASTSEYLYPVKYDQYGHAIQVGTGFNTRTKQDTLPGYNFNTKKFTSPNTLLHVNSQGTAEFVSDNLYSANKGISIANKTIGHTNSAISPRTTLGLYPVKIDSYGHITGTSEAFDPSTKQNTLPSYNSATGKFSQVDKYLHVDSQGTLEWMSVTQPSSEGVVSYTASKGIEITGSNVIQHTNTITAQNTQEVYNVKYDAQGHITAGALYNPNWTTSVNNRTVASPTDSDIIKGVPFIRQGTDANKTAVVIGYGTASAIGAVAEGSSTVAAGGYSHAEGSGSATNAVYSHAEGQNTKVATNGQAAHAEGYYTTASEKYSHAEGMSTIANDAGAHVEGWGTQTTDKYQHVQGKWNNINQKYVDIVGWGTSEYRMNISSLTSEGDLHLKGDVYINANDDGTGGIRLVPPIAGKAGKVLAVNSTNNGLEWITVATSEGGGSANWPTPILGEAVLTVNKPYGSEGTESDITWDYMMLNGISLAGNHTAEDLNLQTKLSLTNQLNPDYIANLATVARTGSYNDLTNKPTIPTVPTKTSAFINDGPDGVHPYLTDHQSLANYATIAYVDTHANDTGIHVTATEKAAWNAKQDPITATAGIQLTGTTLSHTNSIKAGDTEGKVNNTTAKIPSLTWDAQGHLTGVVENTAYIPFTAGTANQYWRSTGSNAAWTTPITAWTNSDTADNNTNTLLAATALNKHEKQNMTLNTISHRNIYVGTLASVTNPIVGDICLVPVS